MDDRPAEERQPLLIKPGRDACPSHLRAKPYQGSVCLSRLDDGCLGVVEIDQGLLKHHPKMSRVPSGESHVRNASCLERLKRRPRVGGGRFRHCLVQPRETFHRDRFQDSQIAAEVVVRRLVTGPRPARHLAEADRADALLGNQVERCVQNLSLQVLHPSPLTRLLDSVTRPLLDNVT